MRLNVRLIVAASNREIVAARNVTTTIPIVMVVAVDPVGAGFIPSLARPRGNLTGLAWAPGVEIVGKHMEFLREVVPNLARIAVLVDPDLPGIGPYRDAAEGAARKLHLTYQEIEIREADDFGKAFAAIVREHSQAVFVQGSPLVFRHLRVIVDLATRHRIPAMKTAKALGLTIPQSLVVRADEIIE